MRSSNTSFTTSSIHPHMRRLHGYTVTLLVYYSAVIIFCQDHYCARSRASPNTPPGTAVPPDVTCAIPYHSRLSGNRSRITTGITCCVHTSGALFRSAGGGVVRVDRHDGSVMQRPAFLAPSLETTLCETQGAPLRAGCLQPKGEWRQGFNDSNGTPRASTLMLS